MSGSDKNSGYTILPVLIIILSLSVLCMSMALLVYSDRRLIKALSDKKDRFEEAQKVCDEVLQSFNRNLSAEEADVKDRGALNAILKEFQDYKTKIVPLSDKLNTLTLKNEILSDKDISLYVKSHPENTGSYSYLNINLTDEKYLSDVVKEHKVKDASSLFPLLSYLPLLNVNNMDEEFLRVVLSYCKVSQSSEKAQRIYSTVRSKGLIRYEELKEIIGERDTSAVWDFLGVKTQMYKVILICEGIGAELVIGAVPYRSERIREVQSYRILEKRFI